MVDVVAEALTNVARHGGPGQAWVSGTIGPQRVQVVVTDTGPGFSFDRDRRRASGLETMVRRMRTVGGTAELTSRPGRGTVVTVRWSPAAPDTAESSRTEWTRRTFTPCSPSAHSSSSSMWGWALTSGAARARWGRPGRDRGDRRRDGGRRPAPADPRLFGVTVVALVVTGTVLAANAAPAAPSDWRYWGVGALTPALGAVAFRCPGRHGAAAAGALVGLVAVTDALLGRPFWAVLAGPGSVLVLTVVAGISSAWRWTDPGPWSTGPSRRPGWRMATAAEGERVEEAIRRVEALDAAAGAALRLVADATELTNEQAEELLVVESAVRDALTAPGLLLPRSARPCSPPGVGAPVEVRRTIAGAGVTRTSRCPRRPWPPSAAVGEARAGDAVRLSWRPADTRLPVVLTYVGQDADSVATRIRRSLGGLGSGGPEVSTDADSVPSRSTARPRPADATRPGVSARGSSCSAARGGSPRPGRSRTRVGRLPVEEPVVDLLGDDGEPEESEDLVERPAHGGQHQATRLKICRDHLRPREHPVGIRRLPAEGLEHRVVIGLDPVGQGAAEVQEGSPTVASSQSRTPTMRVESPSARTRLSNRKSL